MKELKKIIGMILLFIIVMTIILNFVEVERIPLMAYFLKEVLSALPLAAWLRGGK